MERVVVIGNGGGGKSTLAKALSGATGLPWCEIDTIQFRAGWEVAPEEEVRAQVDAVIAGDRWIIDGFGPWDTIERRFERADTIYFVDHPLWIHFWWAAERQIAAARGESRLGGPEGCPLTEITKRMFQAIGWVHDALRPKLLELVERHRSRRTVHRIDSPESLDRVLAEIRRGTP